MKIKYARLHASTFAPGFSTLNQTLDESQLGKDLDMEYNDYFLKVTATKKGQRVTCYIPMTNIAVMSEQSEEKFK